MCEVVKIEKKDALQKNFDSCIADKFVGPHLSDSKKKTRKVKKKKVYQGEGIQKVVVQLPYTWGYVDNIYRIRRSKQKVVKEVSARGNQKAISVGMGRVFPLGK